MLSLLSILSPFTWLVHLHLVLYLSVWMMLSGKVRSRAIINGGMAIIAMSMVFMGLLVTESISFITFH